MRQTCLSVLLAILLIHAGALVREGMAETYHVAALTGRDTFPGTEQKPFKTIGRASKVLQPGDTVLIHEGVYHEQIVGGRSGVEGAPITYQGTDRSKVVLQGSVRVSNWQQRGNLWIKKGLEPITPINAFVMVDERQLLERREEPVNLPEGSFHVAPDGTYTIRLQKDADPNRDHAVEVYELDIGFNSGDRWGGTAKKWVVLRNMTVEKYGANAISTDAGHPADNSHWELDRVTVRYNNAEGVFHCLDDWYVHDCIFMRNRGHGCQIDGARVRFVHNSSRENLWFGFYPDGGCGLLVGPDSTAHSCLVKANLFEANGGPEGYGCGIYLEGRSHGNIVENNLIVGGSTSGVGFFGSSGNKVMNNVLVDIAPGKDWNMAAAFVVGHSHEGEPTQSVGNLVAHNTVWGCPFAIATERPAREIEPLEQNRFVNNLFARCRYLSVLPPWSSVSVDGNGCFSCPGGNSRPAAEPGSRMKTIAAGARMPEVCSPANHGLVLDDPGFRDPANLDFRLQRDSSLIASGVSLEEVTSDKAGNTRPTGHRPAIGAYEYAE